MEPIRIVVADDHAVLRSGLRLLLEAEDGFSVVAEAGEIETARRMVRAHGPEVLVLDLNMPGPPSLQAIPELAQETAVVVLTMQNDTAFARQALQAGARGHVLKEAADAELVQAIRSAVEGRTYLNPELGARMAAAPTQAEGPPRHRTISHAHAHADATSSRPRAHHHGAADGRNQGERISRSDEYERRDDEERAQLHVDRLVHRDPSGRRAGNVRLRRLLGIRNQPSIGSVVRCRRRAASRPVRNALAGCGRAPNDQNPLSRSALRLIARQPASHNAAQ